MESPHYRNFGAAVYARAYEVLEMRDLDWLKARFELIRRCVKVSKVYLETHRDLVVPEEAVLVQARDYLQACGVQVSGGITATVNERNRFQTYCYSDPALRQKLADVVTLTARLFDEVILDDFFFTNCKCPSCVAAKGEQSWTRFRLEQMTQAAQELVLAPARRANPKVQVVIKYPNWYEHFPGLGFNLEDEPPLFDGLYTGTETRDPNLSSQHLQPYGSYLTFRYFENIKPGGNRGGWVDPFGSRNLDRYAEQLWLTLFAKAPEVTLFDFGSIQRPLQEAERAAWQGQGASFDFDAVTAPARQADGRLSPQAIKALAAGAAFEAADRVLGELGSPLGVASYKPFHSHGEDFLHQYLGMLGIPIELTPEFPAEAGTILLSEAAKFDPNIVSRIEHQLSGGKNVVITSGLLGALQQGQFRQEAGIEQIVELELTGRKQTAQQFLIGWNQVYTAERPIRVPKINYLTNDSWEEISCLDGSAGTPLLHSARYAGGVLYVLVIPDSFDDLYSLPAEVLNRLRESLAGELPVRLEGPSQVALFAYDNQTFIVESFRDEAVEVRVALEDSVEKVKDLLDGEQLTGEELLDWRGAPRGEKAYALQLKPHSWRVFRYS